MSERTNSPEQAASQRGIVRASLETDHHPDVHRRRYKPGEVEETAVAAVVREALWAVATRTDGDPTLEQLVDEAAMAAAKVMARAEIATVEREASAKLGMPVRISEDVPPGTFCVVEPDTRVVPEGWRGRLANVERHLSIVWQDIGPTASGGTARAEDALNRAHAEVRSLLDME